MHGQFVEGKDSPFHGRAHVHWLTGTHRLLWLQALKEFGLKPEADGIVIEPYTIRLGRIYNEESIQRQDFECYS